MYPRQDLHPTSRTRERPAALQRAAPAGRALSFTFTALILAGSSAARAAPAKTDPAAAEVLFKSARTLVEAGNYKLGCPKFEASFDLDPSASTLLNIARCHEREGKLATAWIDYTHALVLNRETVGADRRQALENLGKEGREALEPRLPRLRVVVASPPAGLKVLRDGTELPLATLGEALPLDPGEHEVTVRAPGYKTQTRSVRLAEGTTRTLELTLVEAPAGASLSVPQLLEAPSRPSPPPPQDGAPVWPWVTAGASLALIGGGVAFLVDDLNAIRTLTTRCSTDKMNMTSCDKGYDYEVDNGRKNRGFGLFLGLTGAGVIGIGIATFGLVQRRPGAQPQASPTAWVKIAPFGGLGSAGALISGGF